MKRYFILLGITLQLISSSVYCQSVTTEAIENKQFNSSTLLWYKQPAKKWEEALPVGNGRLGAMVFGGVPEERIQLNEETYWTGGPYSTVVKGGYTVLPEIQKLVFEEKMLEAHNLFGRHLMGYPVEQQKYQSLGDLHLFFEPKDSPSNYKRWLDLETGTTATEYTIKNITYKREVFVSHPDQVIVVRLTASQPHSISFTAQLRGVRNQAHSNYATDYFTMDGYGRDGLILKGKSADYLGIEGKLRYEARLIAKPEGGNVKVKGADLIVENVDAITLYVAAATNFVNYQDVSGNQHQRVEDYLNGLETKSVDAIKAAAILDYQKLFNRAKLSLPKTESSFLPTNERLEKIKSLPDPDIAALCYHFMRYLMISSSRPGTQPANLQGIWNQDQNPAWDSKYTTNINTEINYWPVETANLSECVEPLIKMVKELTDQGTQVAREHYGAKGWVFHQNTDLWRVAAPMDGPTWGTFTTGGAWLTTHLWEHYLFTQDENYLKEMYPILKGSVEFFMDFLIEHPNGKWLVTNPSTSPENFPASPGNKPYFDEVTAGYREGTTICAGSSIDMQILTDLFGDYINASTLLKVDQEFAHQVAQARARLVPPQIGKTGALQEWADDWGQLEEKHRHFSHLYGLYPGNVISAKRTPEIAEAAKKVLEQRGDGGTGWSRGWKMSLWARLYDGNRANTVFKGYLTEQAYPQLFAKCFTPMQVDGTFGVGAGITEMIIQSHENVIHLLPALPDEWADGEIIGVCARGAFELSMKWKNKKMVDAKILSKAGKLCRIQTSQQVSITSNGKPVKTRRTADHVVEFQTSKNDFYQLTFK